MIGTKKMYEVLVMLPEDLVKITDVAGINYNIAADTFESVQSLASDVVKKEAAFLVKQQAAKLKAKIAEEEAAEKDVTVLKDTYTKLLEIDATTYTYTVESVNAKGIIWGDYVA